MARSISASAKSRGRPRTTGTGKTIGVRLQPVALARLDAWIAAQPEPKPSRPEALRRLAERGLPKTTEVSVSGERHSWGGDAVMTSAKPKGLK